MNELKFSDAIEALERAAHIDPNNRTLWDRLVICNLELKRPKKALEAMNFILQIDPNAYQIWTEKAYLHFLLQEHKEGIDALQTSLTLNPKNYRDWFLLGSVYIAGEEWDEARWALHNALQLNPNDSKLWYNLAVVNFMLGDLGAAAGAAELAKAIDPTLEISEIGWLEELIDSTNFFGDHGDSLSFDLAAGG